MNPKNLKKDSWYWNKWTFRAYKDSHGLVNILETGGLLQYKFWQGSTGYHVFYTALGGRYCLPPVCVVRDLKPISSAAIDFFMLFTNIEREKH